MTSSPGPSRNINFCLKSIALLCARQLRLRLLVCVRAYNFVNLFAEPCRNPVGECSCLVSLLFREVPVSRGKDPREGGGIDSCCSLDEVDGHGALKVGGVGTGDSTGECPPAEEEQQDVRGVLKRRVETKEHTEDKLRKQEAEQVDFRTVLGKKIVPKSLSEEELKEIPTEQMDFRAKLQRQVKPKTLSEEERKVNSPQQVDFRGVLKSKGTPKVLPQEKAPSKPATPNFRSALNSKKSPPVENNVAPANTRSPQPTKQEEKNDVNCEHGCSVVDGRIIKEEAVSKGKRLVFTELLTDTRVVDGEKLVLQCRVASEPPALVTWTLAGKTIKPSKFIVLSQEGPLCSLTIEKVLPEDRGQYKCVAENSTGRAECACTVHVDDSPATKTPKPTEKKTKKPKTASFPIPATENEATVKKKPPSKTPPKTALPPQILQSPGNMKVRSGEPAELLCKIAGTQPLTCKWLKFKKEIEGSESMKIENTETSSKLTIYPTKHEHSGCYFLQVENRLGSKQVQINLTVVDKPDPPAGTPCASQVRSSTLTLSWYGPTYDGGSVVESYTVEIWNSVDKQWTDLVTCRSTSYYIQNLQPEKEYKFRVRAVNVYGVSEPSQESDPVTVGEKIEERDLTISAISYRLAIPEISVKDNAAFHWGKFGQVFKLVEKKNKKVWAGKFFKAYTAKDKESVRQEISIMNRLHHPKLVQCVDAFESKADVVMVLELVSGGELFERIIDEDFELTERECIQYMQQIIEGVQFIHKQEIVHLDLKPENIMCINKTGTRIKLIDFGLARRLENTQSLKVLFGTPEFVAPEVINYEPIGYPTDMWSIGVICYILMICPLPRRRLDCTQCRQHQWLQKDTKNMAAKKLSKERMKKYMARRKWQKTGHAVRAIGRLSSMAMISGLSAKKVSAGSPTSPSSTETLETTDDVDQKLLEAVAEERPSMKPYFATKIADTEVVEGSAARFDCKIEGYPDPEVIWYRDDQPIKESRHFEIDYDEDGNCSLIISEACGDDDAKYTCKAVNSLGEVTCTAELIVEVMEEGEGGAQTEEE
nr:PREDICTED: myosin light chain kinase, smooth muscle [Latimeria chalumnae]|eukprot:XP_014352130.1 PREDICTED: myosin light chain kinase, smooth muscle [Latimeria chalumnae]